MNVPTFMRDSKRTNLDLGSLLDTRPLILPLAALTLYDQGEREAGYELHATLDLPTQHDCPTATPQARRN